MDGLPGENNIQIIQIDILFFWLKVDLMLRERVVRSTLYPVAIHMPAS